MKTAMEFIKEIEGSEALQKELDAIRDSEALEAVLKKYDCGATVGEFNDALAELCDGEISDDDVESAAGGITMSQFEEKVAKRYKPTEEKAALLRSLREQCKAIASNVKW